MCSTGLLLCKNQKGLTCYPMSLYKRDSTADISLWIFKFFRTSYFTKQLQTTDCKGFLFVRMPDDDYFRRAVQGQLSQREKYCNYFESSGKIWYRLKRTKVFACGRSGRNLKKLSKFAGKSPCWGPSIVKLQHVMAYKRSLGQLYQKRDAYTETLTQVLSVNFEKNMNTTINTSARLPLK